MTIDEAISYGKSKIHSDHAKILLSDLLNINSLELLLHLDEQVPENLIEKYKLEVEAISNNKPIQYALGHINFYGENFYINENVLIPRFETEELVEKTINKAKSLFNHPVDIIDLGTGSGVIGLTLEKKLDTNKVDLIDISEKALKVAKENIKRLNSKANTIKSDMFSNVVEKYDIVISNPPYIKDNEEIEDIVKDNEPHIALYAGEDGLDYYKKIISNIKNHLKDKSLIAFEIGSDQANSIKELLEKKLENIEVEIIKDLQGRDRIILATYNLHK